jgi:hypothetical protein
MSNFSAGYQRPHNPVEDNKSWADSMQVKYPLLVDAMVGSEGSGRSGPKVPPMALKMSAKDGRLRFTLSSQESSRCYSGPISDPSEPLASVESALGEGTGEWWDKPKNSR